MVISGPEDVRSTIYENARGHELVMSHDGYAALFGLVHERTLILEQDGKSLFGVDTLSGRPIEGYDEFAIRFHIHPGVSASMTSGVDIALEESIYMSETFGHRRSEQIVIYGNAGKMNSVTWSFVQSGSARSRPLSEVDLEEAMRLEEENYAAEPNFVDEPEPVDDAESDDEAVGKDA